MRAGLAYGVEQNMGRHGRKVRTRVSHDARRRDAGMGRGGSSAVVQDPEYFAQVVR